MCDLDDKDKICIGYALGLLYQFLIDNFGDIKAELESLGYTDIITLERLIKLRDKLLLV